MRASGEELSGNSLYQLVLELRGMHPIEMLDYASNSIAGAGRLEGRVRSGLYASGYFEASLLAKSMEWLVDRRPPESLLDPDTPAWLFELDRGEIRAAKRRRTEHSTSYLLEVELADGSVGSMQVRIDNERDGAISNYFAVSDPLNLFVKLLQALERNAHGTYRTVKRTTAHLALSAGRTAFDTNPYDTGLANPWPKNRALLDFVLDNFGPS